MKMKFFVFSIAALVAATSSNCIAATSRKRKIAKKVGATGQADGDLIPIGDTCTCITSSGSKRNNTAVNDITNVLKVGPNFPGKVLTLMEENGFEHCAMTVHRQWVSVTFSRGNKVCVWTTPYQEETLLEFSIPDLYAGLSPDQTQPNKTNTRPLLALVSYPGVAQNNNDVIELLALNPVTGLLFRQEIQLQSPRVGHLVKELTVTEMPKKDGNSKVFYESLTSSNSIAVAVTSTGVCILLTGILSPIPPHQYHHRPTEQQLYRYGPKLTQKILCQCQNRMLYYGRWINVYGWYRRRITDPNSTIPKI